MVNISKYIYDYLMEGNASVVVPDLGCFSIVTKPSVIQDNVVIPPVKTVKLDTENTEDNQVFTRYIAEKENITVEQAADEIHIFYIQFFIQKLAENRRPISFENLGTFSLNESGDINFEPDPNFFKDNYGLGHVHIAGDTTSPPKSTQPEQETKNTSPKTDDSLFNVGDTSRYRENKDRRQPVAEKVPPVQPPKPAQPLRPPQPSKPFNPAKAAPYPNKQPKGKKTNNSNLWVLWVLLIAAGLGVAGYFLYPKIGKSLNQGRPVAVVEPKAEPTVETGENTPNAEVAQSLNEATDKKNALNPAGSQQTETAKSSAASAAQSQIKVGSGKWVLIAGSFKIQSNAERFVKTLQAEGFNCEIIFAKNQLHWVTIASYDTLAEAARQAEQIKSKREVWVARR